METRTCSIMPRKAACASSMSAGCRSDASTSTEPSLRWKELRDSLDSALKASSQLVSDLAANATFLTEMSYRSLVSSDGSGGSCCGELIKRRLAVGILTTKLV